MNLKHVTVNVYVYAYGDGVMPHLLSSQETNIEATFWKLFGVTHTVKVKRKRNTIGYRYFSLSLLSQHVDAVTKTSWLSK